MSAHLGHYLQDRQGYSNDLRKTQSKHQSFFFLNPNTNTHTNTDRQTWKGGELHFHEDM